MVEKIVTQNGNTITILTTKAVIELHEILSEHSELDQIQEKIYPRGVKDEIMLQSAVARQKVGFSKWLKYETIFKSSATLVFGLVKNHAFHNGNKRVSFLSLLFHLFHNDFVLKGDLDPNKLYKLFIAIAENKNPYEIHSIFGETLKKKDFRNVDEEDLLIYTIAKFIKSFSIQKNSQIKRFITLKDLKESLKLAGLEIEVKGNSIEIYKLSSMFLGFSAKKKNRKTYTISSNKNEVSYKVINSIRRDYGLTKVQGVDYTSFLNAKDFLDNEIKNYKTLIYRLAKV
jgi:death-on-curing family protein